MKIQETSRELRLVVATMILANVGSMMYVPILPLYLEKLGANIQQVGLFYTLQLIGMVSFRILGGWVSDHIGRLKSIAFGSLFGTANFIILALAPTWEWAILGALAGAIGSSLVGPSFNSFTAEQAPRGSMSSTYGLVNGLFITCMVVGPLMGGVIAENYGYETMLWIGTAIFGVATVMRVWLIRYETTKRKPMRPGELVTDVRGLLAFIFAGGLLLWLCIGGGMVDAAYQLTGTFAPKYITEVGQLSETSYSAIYAMMALASAVVMLPGGMFADRFGERWGIAVGTSLFGGAWIAMTIMPKTMLMFSMVAIVAGVGRAFSRPAISSLVSKSVPESSRGMAWGAYMTVLSMFTIPLPYIGGVLYDNLRPEATFVLIAGICAIAVPVALLKLRLPSEKHKQKITGESVPAPLAK